MTSASHRELKTTMVTYTNVEAAIAAAALRMATDYLKRRVRGLAKDSEE